MGGMFTMMFSSAADHIVNDVTVGGVVTVMQVHSLFGVAHLLLAAVILGAPYIAAQLVSNQSAVASLVTPFFAAAAATAAALFQSHKPIPVPRIPLVPGGNPSSPMQGGPRPVGSPSAARPGSIAHELGGGGPRPLSPAPVDAATRAASLARNGEFSNSRTPRPKKRSDVLLDAARANRETTTSDTNTNTQAQDSAVGTRVTPDGQQHKRQRSQARRGAIVNQMKKRKET